MKQSLHILIMAGGSGTRFWPKSRAKKPKQLLALWDDKTLIEHTIARFETTVPLKNIWIVTTEVLAEPTREVLGGKYADVRILAEPMGKNTAACILWGAKEIAKVDAKASIAVMPADHFIENEKAFLGFVDAAIEASNAKGGIVTLGIRADRPETGYGYIEADGDVASAKVLNVKQFVEKPDVRTALRYLESGRFLWNAGMFIFSVSEGLKAFETCMPNLNSLFDKELPNGISSVYSKITAEDAVSVDYGIMEVAGSKGISVQVVPASCGWNDVGSFPALEEINCSTRGEVITHDCGSNVVQTDHGLVALLGVSDLVVVRDGDVVMVASKDRAQDVKKLLDKVKAKHPELG